jgi:hypothetical protein
MSRDRLNTKVKSFGYVVKQFCLLATAYLDGGEVCRQTDTGNLELIRFYAPLDIGLVVSTSSSPSRGRNPFGEK